MLSPDEFEALFARKIDKSGECWLWTGASTKKGYGWTRLNGEMFYLHRLSYAAHVGALPHGKPCVLHTCDNPPCCRPAHLFPGTKGDNNQDSFYKGRLMPPRRGAVLSVDQVETIRTRYATGREFQRELASEFGVAQTTISQATRGGIWTRAAGAFTQHPPGSRRRA